MKKLESKRIEQLLSIIPEHPATRIMYITQNDLQLSDLLASFVKKRDYEFLLNVTDDIFYEEVKDRYEDESTTVKKMKFEQRRYVSMAKQYDYIFVSATVPENLQEQFAKTIHSHIKNAGNIILFLPKNNLMILDSWQRTFVENYFVATNNIDIFENYEILISKKMHGWGG
jgi:hypothetical protein